MNDFKIIKTLPQDARYELFRNLPISLYEQNSPRFILGNDPTETHLEGCYVLLNAEKPVGRFSFYENKALKHNNEKAACIGSYECVDDIAASTFLLDYAKEIAKSKGYSWLIGPMEGSTWHNYRFSKHNDYTNFFMEPYHHIYYNHQFEKAGFVSIADYFSNKDESLDCDCKMLVEFEKRYVEQGAIFRNLNLDDLRNDLTKIGRFSIECFASNFLYTPISVGDFVVKYEKLERYFDPQLVWIVEDAERNMHAFIFAIKDFMDPSGETLIIKSLVRKQSSSFKGIGNYLANRIMQIAIEMGYKTVIHAFMLSENVSMTISEKYVTDSYKSYALYGLEL